MAAKRFFDLLVSVPLLILLAIPMLIVALLVRLTSVGPALFRHSRVGHTGRPFNVLKFRTMRDTQTGPQVTIAGDSRVTSFGLILRNLKIDELPQLINVVRGEMSLVGPRPEVAEYVKQYSPIQQEVLSARPGITDWASLKYRDEASRLATFQDPVWAYRNIVLPDKLRLGVKYVRASSLSNDLRILVNTAKGLMGLKLDLDSEQTCKPPQESSSDSATIRPATFDDLSCIAFIHQRSFPKATLSQLGTTFLRVFYKNVLGSSQAIVFVAEVEGIVVGFVAGYCAPATFYRRLLRRNAIRFGGASLVAALSGRVNLRKIIARAAARRSTPPGDVELASLACIASAQGRGIGSLLIERFIQSAREKGGAGIYVGTRDLRTVRLYQNHGFVIASEISEPEGTTAYLLTHLLNSSTVHAL